MKANRISLAKGLELYAVDTQDNYLIWFQNYEDAKTYGEYLGKKYKIVRGTLTKDVEIYDEDIPYSTRIKLPSFVIRTISDTEFVGTLFPNSSRYIKYGAALSNMPNRRVVNITKKKGPPNLPSIVLTQRDTLGLIINDLDYDDAISLCMSNKQIYRKCEEEPIAGMLDYKYEEMFNIFPQNVPDYYGIFNNDLEYYGIFSRDEAFLYIPRFGYANLLELNRFAYLFVQDGAFNKNITGIDAFMPTEEMLEKFPLIPEENNQSYNLDIYLDGNLYIKATASYINTTGQYYKLKCDIYIYDHSKTYRTNLVEAIGINKTNILWKSTGLGIHLYNSSFAPRLTTRYPALVQSGLTPSVVLNFPLKLLRILLDIMPKGKITIQTYVS